MIRSLTFVVIVALLGVPASVHAVDVYRTPFIPAPPPELRAGTVIVSTSVFDGLMWATDQTLIHPGPTIDVDCGELPSGGA